MTRKHFTAAARAVRVELDYRRLEGDHTAVLALIDVARNLATEFAGFNPAFDRERFLVAAGVLA